MLVPTPSSSDMFDGRDAPPARREPLIAPPHAVSLSELVPLALFSGEAAGGSAGDYLPRCPGDRNAHSGRRRSHQDPLSSGKTYRVRFNRGGNRQANAAPSGRNRSDAQPSFDACLCQQTKNERKEKSGDYTLPQAIDRPGNLYPLCRPKASPTSAWQIWEPQCRHRKLLLVVQARAHAKEHFWQGNAILDKQCRPVLHGRVDTKAKLSTKGCWPMVIGSTLLSCFAPLLALSELRP
ncbi:hypothetical protein FB595_12930 [Sphingobium sp. AEW010]|nr:hypothetical protein [Sphingobium sp. JAI105]TWC98185.1 hypothetical protein FB595_12930 [Sphingobium sp. AEW010]TWD18247.1 hypothetical protein FB596_13030 [Sphingobium sp. AEW013]TWD20763.1 hypothetical protein FB594_1304 [Sphingobium sp. AEW001]